MSTTQTTEKKGIQKPEFKDTYDNFIGGKWTAPVKGEYFESISERTFLKKQ